MTSWPLTVSGIGKRRCSSPFPTPRQPTTSLWPWLFRRCSTCFARGQTIVHGGRLPHHVRVLWDEAANTGQVPNLEKLVAVIRSREISLTLFYQQMAQCKAIYDKHAETIMGNMDSVVFLGGRESSTIKEISGNWLGKSTIYMQTDGRSKRSSRKATTRTPSRLAGS